eukprot:m.21131 g.21131  ORF g.21131 m.21131 type:complete len:1118 (+) comp5328_c0_seq1:47-3400(+)
MDFRVVSFVLVCLCCTSLCEGKNAPKEEAPHLDRHLHHHEVLGMDDVLISHVAGRRRESTSTSRQVTFSALGEQFDLHLSQNIRLFQEPVRASIRHKNGTVERFDIDVENYFEGKHRRFSDPRDSSVFLYIRDNILKGHIRLENTTYFVEPSSLHYPHRDDIHMIIYRNSDMVLQDPNSLHDHNGTSYCGADSEEHKKAHEHAINREKWYSDPRNHDREMPTSADTSDAASRHDRNSSDSSIPYQRRVMQRQRRVDGGQPVSSTYDTCRVTVVADTRFYSQHEQDRSNTVSSMLLHVDVANSVFYNTMFDTDLYNLRLFVHEVKIEDGADYVSTSSVNNMLSDFSGYDFSQSCIAHLFTRVDFSGGTLGLAWVGSADPARAGGICHSSARQWLNTGLTSSINYGESVPFATTSLVTSHEMGHNWGSSHDDPEDSTCAPSAANGGKYLMYAIAVNGDDTNNDKFSPCSIGLIRDVLHVKGTCFTTTPRGVCGNGKTEEDPDNPLQSEECDAGGASDACCNSQCELKTPQGIVTQCTPNNNICCDDTCTFFPDNTHQCYDPVDLDPLCRAAGVCVGGACEDPLPPKAAGLPCGRGGRCVEVEAYEDRCTPFCERFGATQCDCANENECRLCCQHNPVINCASVECGCPFMGIEGCALAADVITEAAFAGLPQCFADVESDPSNTRYEDNPIITPCTEANVDDCLHVLDLSPGTPCSIGLCNRGGVCEKGSSGIARFWDPSNFSINALAQWARNNIVGTVMIIAFIIWLPIGCYVHKHDRKQRELDENYGKRVRRGTMRRSINMDFLAADSVTPAGPVARNKRRASGQKERHHRRSKDRSDGRRSKSSDGKTRDAHGRKKPTQQPRHGESTEERNKRRGERSKMYYLDEDDRNHNRDGNDSKSGRKMTEGERHNRVERGGHLVTLANGKKEGRNEPRPLMVKDTAARNRVAMQGALDNRHKLTHKPTKRKDQNNDALDVERHNLQRQEQHRKFIQQQQHMKQQQMQRQLNQQQLQQQRSSSTSTSGNGKYLTKEQQEEFRRQRAQTSSTYATPEDQARARLEANNRMRAQEQISARDRNNNNMLEGVRQGRIGTNAAEARRLRQEPVIRQQENPTDIVLL